MVRIVDMGYKPDFPNSAELRPEDSSMAKQIKQCLKDINEMPPAERMQLLLICSIGDRVDRLINMVRLLNEKH